MATALDSRFLARRDILGLTIAALAAASPVAASTIAPIHVRMEKLDQLYGEFSAESVMERIIEAEAELEYALLDFIEGTAGTSAGILAAAAPIGDDLDWAQARYLDEDDATEAQIKAIFARVEALPLTPEHSQHRARACGIMVGFDPAQVIQGAPFDRLVGQMLITHWALA